MNMPTKNALLNIGLSLKKNLPHLSDGEVATALQGLRNDMGGTTVYIPLNLQRRAKCPVSLPPASGTGLSKGL